MHLFQALAADNLSGGMWECFDFASAPRLRLP